MAHFRTALEVGDRAPNFILPARDGENYMFYDRVAGGPILLSFLKTGDQWLNRVVSELSAALPREAEWFTVSACAQDQLKQRFQDQDDLKRLDFADPRGVVAQAFGITGDGTALTFVLDPNQRILGIVDDADASQHSAAVSHIFRTAWQMQPIGNAIGTAPVIILPHALPQAMCDMLVKRWESDHHEGQVSGSAKSGVYASKKRSLDHIIEDDQLCQQITQALGRRVIPELHKAFTFDGTLTFTRYILAGYTGARKDFFGLHRDNLTAATQNRRFAISLNLNEGFEGGCLRFPEYGNLLYSLPVGTACVFSCSLLHEATVVTKGTRIALTTFLCNPSEG